MKSLGRTQTLLAGGIVSVLGLSVFWTFVPPSENVTTFAEIVFPTILGALTAGGAYVKGKQNLG